MGTAAQSLLRMGLRFAVAQALHVVAELQIADLLHGGPRTAENLAVATGSDADALSSECCAFSRAREIFTEQSPGLFANTELGEALRAEAPQVQALLSG